MERMEMIKSVFRLLNTNLLQAKQLVDFANEYAKGLDQVGDNEKLTAIYCIHAADTNKLSEMINYCKVEVVKDCETHDCGDFCDINTDWQFHTQHIIYYSRIYKYVSSMMK